MTHDLGVVADIADRVAVMYAGRIVEQGTLDEIFYDPQHPYTWGLLGAITRIDRPRRARLPTIPGLPPSLANRPDGLPPAPALPARVRRVRRRCRRWRRARRRPPGTAIAAGCRVERKRRLREIAPGEIGLAPKAPPPKPKPRRDAA